MNVTVLSETRDPERTVCLAARGDYWAGNLSEATFEEVMEPVSYTDEDYFAAEEYLAQFDLDWEFNIVTEAKKRAFIRKLYKKGHFGPFEHASITFHVEGVSRACMAQITRHRHASFDVRSQRYVNFADHSVDELVVTPPSVTEASVASRHGGVIEFDDDGERQEVFDEAAAQAVESYRTLLDLGVPAEDARFVLPIGSMVNFTMTVNARSLLHIMDMRRTGAAQWEVRELADELLAHAEEWAPTIFGLYREQGHPNKLAP